nr:MAG TPA: hypothetical protein [Caudoviricetes sp.]
MTLPWFRGYNEKERRAGFFPPSFDLTAWAFGSALS